MTERLAKRPVAWRVKDYADGWVIFQDEAPAYKLAEETGATMQGLYVRDGTDGELCLTRVSRTTVRKG